MKTTILFIICAVIAAAGTIWYLKPTPQSKPTSVRTPIPSGTTFSIDHAPSQSLQGSIIALSGDVQWLSRIASHSALITVPQPIQQGEEVSTGATGKLGIEFKTCCMLTLAPETTVSFVQTLPDHVVFVQPTGKVTYTSPSSPIAVRSLHVLLELQGNATITVTEEGTIQARVTQGSMTAGFNDDDNKSQRVSVTSGELFVFDDATRTATVD